MVNYSCAGTIRYMIATLLGVLLARMEGKIVYLYFSVDEIDLLESRVKKVLLYPINFAIVQLSTVLLLLKSRDHYRHRYCARSKPFYHFESCPEIELWGEGNDAERPPRESGAPLQFFYHGSLLWWHGLNRFFPILEEIRKKREARLTLVGSHTPSGMGMDPIGERYAKEIWSWIERGDAQHLGKVPENELINLMTTADFHVTHFDSRSVQGNTEVRTGLLEAMAAGMACLHVPTNALNAHSLFRDGENIVLVDPDQPKASAEKILALADDPEQLSRIRQNARRTIEEHFSLDEMLARFRSQRIEIKESRPPGSPGVFSSAAAVCLRHLGRFLGGIK